MDMDRTQICSLYETYKNGIFRYALSITKDPGLAEDVLHDSFVKLLSGKLPRPGSEQAWLYRVARNLCYDLLRKQKREQAKLSLPVSTDSDFEYINMICSLSPQEQEIVTLKITGGLTHREIGAVLGISAQAAQKRYERALSKLTEKEDEHGT